MDDRIPESATFRHITSKELAEARARVKQLALASRLEYATQSGKLQRDLEHRLMQGGMHKAGRFWDTAKPGERFDQYIMPFDTETGHNNEILSRSYMVLGRHGTNGPWKFVEGNDRFYYPTNETSPTYRASYDIHRLDTKAVAHARAVQKAKYSRHFNDSERAYLRGVQRRYGAVVVGHNIADQELKRTFGGDFHGSFIDTLAMMQNTRGMGGNSQPQVYKDLFGVTPSQSGLIEHRASEDTIANARILTGYLKQRANSKTAQQINKVLSTPGVSYTFRDSYTGEAIIDNAGAQGGVEKAARDAARELIDPSTRQLRDGFSVTDIGQPIVDEQAGDAADQFLQEALPRTGRSSAVDAAVRAELQKTTHAITHLGGALTRNAVAMESSATRQRPQQIAALARFPRQKDWDAIMDAMHIPASDRQQVAFAARAKQDAMRTHERAVLLSSMIRQGHGDAPVARDMMADLQDDWDLTEADKERLAYSQQIADQTADTSVRDAKRKSRIWLKKQTHLADWARSGESGGKAREALHKWADIASGQVDADQVWKATEALHDFNEEMKNLKAKTEKTNKALSMLAPLTTPNMHLYDPMRMAKTQEQATGDITDALKPWLPRSVGRAVSRAGQGLSQHAWVNAITQSNNTRVGNKYFGALGNLATGIATISGHPILAAAIGGGINAVQAGVDLMHFRKEEAIAKPARTIAGNLNLLNLLTVPIKMFQDALKATTFSLGNFGLRIRNILDTMSGLGVPLTHLTGVHYPQYQQSLALDAGTGLPAGSTNAMRESIAMMSRDMMTRGQFDQNKLVASAMLGVFDDVYVKGDADAMMNRLLKRPDLNKDQMSWLRTVSPEAAQQYEMYKLMGLNHVPTSPSEFHYIYSRPISDRERGRFGIDAYEWEAQRTQLNNSRLRLADFVYNHGGRTLFNSVNKAVDMGVQGDWKGAIAAIKAGGKELWATIASVLTGKDDASLKDIGSAVWNKIREALSSVLVGKDDASFKDIGRTIWDNIKEAVKGLDINFDNIGNKLQATLLKVLQSIGPAASATVASIAEELNAYHFGIRVTKEGIKLDATYVTPGERALSSLKKLDWPWAAYSPATGNYESAKWKGWKGHEMDAVKSIMSGNVMLWSLTGPDNTPGLVPVSEPALRDLRRAIPASAQREAGYDGVTSANAQDLYEGGTKLISQLGNLVTNILADVTFQATQPLKIPVQLVDRSGQPISGVVTADVKGAVQAASGSSNR